MHARLGDLDWKTPGGRKAEYWLDTERRLIDEGWYTGTEESATRRNGVDPVRHHVGFLSAMASNWA